ncbi:MAG TPA: hypothetical protein VN823_23985 [Stellaceae bacterium]|nr:hypothetical protein [Stellaceae bacterium]
MAHEPAFRRVVILCDGACDIRLAVGDAATLAARWGVALHGIYLGDENLRRLAALPFGQQVSLSGAVLSEDLHSGDVATLSSALGAGMRRAVAEAAEKLGIEWSFGSTNELPSASALAGDEGDMLVIEGVTRAFSGSWRPRSALEHRAGAFTRTLLIRCRRHEGRGVLIILPAAAGDRRKVLEAGAAMAAGEDDITVLAPDTRDAERQSTATIGAAGVTPRLRFETRSADGPALLHRIAAINPALIAIDGGESVEVIRTLISEARHDLLIVR